MRLWMASLVVALSATSAMAHDDVHPHRRPTVAAPAMPTPPPSPAARTAPPPLDIAPMTRPSGVFAATGLDSGGLAAARLRSPLRSGADVAAQCRARCTAERLACADDDTLPQCAPRWSSCTAACAP